MLGRADRLVGQKELSHDLAVVGLARLHFEVGEAWWLGVRVSVEHQFRDRAAAWPEAATADLVRVGFLRHPVRHVGDAARMLRRPASREAGDGKIAASPEEVHRAALAEEAATEALQHPIGLR